MPKLMQTYLLIWFVKGKRKKRQFSVKVHLPHERAIYTFGTHCTSKYYCCVIQTFTLSVAFASFKCLLWELLLCHTNVSSECNFWVIQIFPLSVTFASFKCYSWRQKSISREKSISFFRRRRFYTLILIFCFFS